MKGFAKALKAVLKQNGCQIVRADRGDHEMWYSPVSKRHFPVDNSCKSRHTANEVLKQAGLDKAF
jgi:hypothetical protein